MHLGLLLHAVVASLGFLGIFQVGLSGASWQALDTTSNLHPESIEYATSQDAPSARAGRSSKIRCRGLDRAGTVSPYPLTRLTTKLSSGFVFNHAGPGENPSGLPAQLILYSESTCALNVLVL